MAVIRNGVLKHGVQIFPKEGVRSIVVDASFQILIDRLQVEGCPHFFQITRNLIECKRLLKQKVFALVLVRTNRRQDFGSDGSFLWIGKGHFFLPCGWLQAVCLFFGMGFPRIEELEDCVLCVGVLNHHKNIVQQEEICLTTKSWVRECVFLYPNLPRPSSNSVLRP